MVKAPDFCERHHATFRRCLDASWRGRVLLKGEMGARPMRVEDVSGQQAAQMRLAQDDDVIQTLAAEGSDQSLRVRMLPGTGRGRHDVRDAHAGDAAPEHVAVDRVTIPHEPSRRGVVGKGFNDLLRRPCGRGRGCDRQVDDSSALVREQHDDEQHVSREGRDREEVHRDQACCVIGQERSPRLGGRMIPSPAQPRHGPLRDLDAERVQFAMDSRRSPQRIRGSHQERAGLDHFEGRTYPGWQHHVVLTAVAHAYIQRERMRRGAAGLTFPQLRAIVQEIFTALLFAAKPRYMHWMEQATHKLHLRI